MLGLSHKHLFIGVAILDALVPVHCPCGCGGTRMAPVRVLEICPLPFVVLRIRLRAAKGVPVG